MTITILNKQWELKELLPMSATVFGSCDIMYKNISIRQDLSDEAKQETLIHETAHAIIYETSIREYLTDEQQEQYCEFVKFAYPIIKDVLRQVNK